MQGSNCACSTLGVPDEHHKRYDGRQADPDCAGTGVPPMKPGVANSPDGPKDHTTPEAQTDRPQRKGIKRQMLKGGGLLAVGEMVGTALRFIRSIVAARLLMPADFGVAATFAMTVALLEMISELGADKLLVQCNENESHRLQGTSQLLAVVRGLIMAALIFAGADVIAWMFKRPDAVAAFRCLALVPLLRGFIHQDPVRLQRQMRFGPVVWAQVCSAVTATLLIWPLAYWLRSYWALLWMMVIDAGLNMALTHYFSERRYRCVWDREMARRLAHFGWPLLINGLLIFGIFQGDQLIIGTGYTMDVLGVYSVAFTIAMIPTTVFTKVCASLSLPMLANARDDEERFRRLYSLAQQALGALSTAMGMGMIVAGPLMITILYGSKYAGAALYLSWLGAMQTVRLMRIGPTVAALARGDSRVSLIANVFRMLAMPVAIGIAVFGADAKWIAISALGGETLALAASALCVRWRHGVSTRYVLRPGVLYAIGMASAAGLTVLIPNMGFLAVAVSLVGLWCGLLVAMVATSPQLRDAMRPASAWRTEWAEFRRRRVLAAAPISTQDAGMVSREEANYE